MGFSVIGVMMMNMFGIPLTGVDICGFTGDTNGELCARWHVVGSFYPFSRNHNNYDAKSQEPYVFKDEYYEDNVSYMSIMKMAITNKYHLIRYYYTQFMMMSLYGTGSFYNPLFFSFPDDINAYDNTHYNIMIGPAFKLSINSDSLTG
jgi:alpha-glucosidase (family GH31 glycosyl hydrolase)